VTSLADIKRPALNTGDRRRSMLYTSGLNGFSPEGAFANDDDGGDSGEESGQVEEACTTPKREFQEMSRALSLHKCLLEVSERWRVSCSG